MSLHFNNNLILLLSPSLHPHLHPPQIDISYHISSSLVPLHTPAAFIDPSSKNNPPLPNITEDWPPAISHSASPSLIVYTVVHPALDIGCNRRIRAY